MFSKQRLTALALGGVAALAIAAGIACGDDDAPDAGHTPHDHPAVISAISILDKAGLHDIATAINEKSEIPATARATAQKLQAVVALTPWPAEFATGAKALETAFADMAKALDGEKPDTKVAGAAAEKAHDLEHDFSDRVWAHLKAEAGIAGGAEAPHKD